jgi:hypothetical protein
MPVLARESLAYGGRGSHSSTSSLSSAGVLGSGLRVSTLARYAVVGVVLLGAYDDPVRERAMRHVATAPPCQWRCSICERMFAIVWSMEHARLAFAFPDDPDLIGRLVTALNSQDDWPMCAGRSGQTVLAFESVTAELMLRRRVIQALEVAIGPDWQGLARPLT